MLRKLWLLSAPPDVSSVVSEEVSEVLVVVGGALSVGSGGVCRLADSRLACFARCYTYHRRLPHFAWHAMYCTIVDI